MKRTLLIVTAISFFVAGLGVCAFAKGPESIRIGVNAPLTGDIPKVGEGTKFAARMWLEDVNAAGGIEVGGKKYKVELIIEDNESKAESAVKANTKLITEEDVLAIVGPQSSKQAIPAGGKANELGTPMISPWSTNPDTTKDRPFVFRGCFLDPFQGPVVPILSKTSSVSKRRPFFTMSPATTPKDWLNFSRRPGKSRTGPARLWPTKVSPPKTPTSAPS